MVMSKEQITLGGGCFWCIEAVFESLRGVEKVASGYMGGITENPTYREVCTGRTGHVEVVQIHFDPTIVSLTKILEVFFTVHDPTTLNQQGGDRGTQYRSGIYFHSPEQREIAKDVLEKLETAGVFDSMIVTELVAASTFYQAENDHQGYFELNGDAPYCRAVIQPKMDKLKAAFSELLR
jgi:peptide-methionine (S)-S-oxide reductase